MDTLILATANPGKVAELQALLADTGIRVLSMYEVPGLPDVEEDADTFEGNALKKAHAIYAHTRIPALADDSGLEVDALGGRPGVWSARYAGEPSDAVANIRKLLRELEGVPEPRTARFRTVLAYVDAHGARTYEGVCEGRILNEVRGSNGFGYDPVFVPEGDTRTFAEMTPSEKHARSHRGRALQAFLSDPG